MGNQLDRHRYSGEKVNVTKAMNSTRISVLLLSFAGGTIRREHSSSTGNGG